MPLLNKLECLPQKNILILVCSFQVRIIDYLSAPPSQAASCLVRRDYLLIKMFVVPNALAYCAIV
jgi:hypothetical protein